MLYALDIETTGLNPFNDKILCIGVWSPNESYCFRSVEEFISWSSSISSLEFVTHSGSFDINFLRRHGCDISNLWSADTRSLASILIPRPSNPTTQEFNLGLEFLSKHCLNLPDYKLDRTRMSEYDWDTLKQYNLEDCRRTYLLFQYCINKLDEDDLAFAYGWLMSATKFCAELEYHGMFIDKNGLVQYAKEQEIKRDQLLTELNELTKNEREEWNAKEVASLSEQYREMSIKALVKAKDKEKTKQRYQRLFMAAKEKIEPFNWNSPKQLVWLLENKYGLDLYSEREAKITTNEAMLLEHVAHPTVAKLLQYRESEKLVNTCIPALLDNIQPDGRVHGRYNIGGTVTGRLSSSKPNLQQIPRGQIRSYVIAPEGMTFISSDLGQIEPRLIAHASEDHTLLKTFRDGLDIYSVLGKALFPELDGSIHDFKEQYPDHRSCAKTLALACFYGVGARKFKEQIFKDLQINLSFEDAKQQIKNFMEQFPSVAGLKMSLERRMTNQRKIRNLLGRPIYIESNDDLRKSLNLYIQGSASDLLIHAVTKFIVNNLTQANIQYEPVMLIHDQVVIAVQQERVDEAKDIIKAGMTTLVEQDLGLSVPLKTDIIISERWVK